MISNPKLGQRVQLWYGAKTRAGFLLHGAVGVVEIVGRSRPRNHAVRLGDGRLVVVPAGNLRPVVGAEGGEVPAHEA